MQVSASLAATMRPSTDDTPLSDEFARDAWAQCLDENDAESVLVATLTIPGIIEGLKYEVPIKKCRLKDEAGNLTLPNEYCPMLNCDGASGCLGVSICVEVDLYAGADAGLPLSIYIYWIQGGQPNGQINRQLVIPVGPATQISGSGSSTLAIAFRPARHALTNPVIER